MSPRAYSEDGLRESQIIGRKENKMNFIYTVIGYPLGWVMWFFYNILGNSYVLSLLLFTVFTRLLLLPSTIKQQKNMVKNAKLKPKLDALQKKYGKNKEKYQEEMMKLYEKEGYNPMSGCLPMLIQFPILFGLIDVVYKPLSHILRLPGDVIDTIVEATGQNAMRAQVWVLGHLDTLEGVVSADIIEQIKSLNMNFFGMNLGEQPTWAFNWLLIIPILSGITAYASSIISTKMTAQNMEGAGMMKGMMLLMPILSVVISFSVPAGVGLYWIFSNVISAVQTVILHKVYDPQKIAAELEAQEEQKKEEERQARIEAKKEAQLARKEGRADEITNEGLSQKEINKRKIAEARKRMAEKYGEEYVDED